MSSSKELIVKQNSYIYNKNRLNEVVNNLNSSIGKLNFLIEIEKKAYKIDDASGSGSYLIDFRDKEKSIYNNLVNNVIPSIQSKINKLEYQIIDAKTQEKLSEEAGVEEV